LVTPSPSFAGPWARVSAGWTVLEPSYRFSCYDRDTPHSRQVHIPFDGYKDDMISSYASPPILKRDPARRERWARDTPSA
jgi:hypothetical protein